MALPDLTTRPEQERQRATGTDGKSLVPGLVSSLVERRTSKGSPVSSGGTETEPDRKGRPCVNPDECGASDRSGHRMARSGIEADRMWRSGRAAEGDGLENRCSDHVSGCLTETNEPLAAQLGVLLGVLERECPELTAIIAAWADLPEHIRQAIITLVESVIQRDSNSVVPSLSQKGMPSLAGGGAGSRLRTSFSWFCTSHSSP